MCGNEKGLTSIVLYDNDLRSKRSGMVWVRTLSLTMIA